MYHPNTVRATVRSLVLGLALALIFALLPAPATAAAPADDSRAAAWTSPFAAVQALIGRWLGNLPFAGDRPTAVSAASGAGAGMDPNGLEAGAGMDPNGLEAGAGMDPNGLEAGAGMDPNG